MTQQFVMTHRAGENERFAKDAFDSQIGKIVPLTFRKNEDDMALGELANLRIVSAVILDEGRAVKLTLEAVEDEVTADNVRGFIESDGVRPSMSFGFRSP